MRQKVLVKKPICRAVGNSRIYETSHREHLTILRENHERNFAAQEQHIAALAVGKIVPKEEYIITVFGKEISTSKEMYETWLRQRQN